MASSPALRRALRRVTTSIPRSTWCNSPGLGKAVVFSGDHPMCNGKRMKRSWRRGAALVEFAVIAPIFLTMTGGMIELGRAIVVVQHLTNASREGARIAGYNTTTSASTVTSAVNTYLTNEGISGATTAI